MALHTKTAAAIQAKARQRKLHNIAVANSKLGSQYIYSFFRDKLFPISKSVRLLTQTPFWSQSPSLSSLDSRPDKGPADPKAFRSVILMTLPSVYHNHFHSDYVQGTVDDYTQIARALIGPTSCSTPQLQAARNCFISLTKTSPLM